MYKIGLRSGAPVSAGHMIAVPGNSVTGNARPGQLVCVLQDGIYAATNTDCPDGIVSQWDEENTGEYGSYPNEAIVMLIDADMILEAPVSGTDVNIENLVPGKFIGFDSNGVNAGATSKYCQVVATNSAKTAGDTILVRFVNNNASAT